jgi:hypothetical protein
MIVSIFFIAATFSAKIEKKDVIEKTFRFKNPDAKNLIVVDNVWGDICVTGYDGEEIRMKANKRLSATSDAILKEIDKEVTLDIDEKDDMIELYVDGSFRNDDPRSRGHWRKKYQNIKARYDFEIQIPKETDIELRTVNDGEITVQNVKGDYQVNNVNGGIVMEKIDGSGEAYTVNGDLTIDFEKNPSDDCRYGSLNGKVQLYFLHDLSADFNLKTFNGEFYFNFPVSSLLVEASRSAEKKKRRNLCKGFQLTAVRAGEGGPTFMLDGFNGNMYILEKKQQ